MTYREHMRAATREYLRELFISTQGNLTEAARRAGLNRGTIYVLMRKVQVKPEYRKRKAHCGRWQEMGL